MEDEMHALLGAPTNHTSEAEQSNRGDESQRIEGVTGWLLERLGGYKTIALLGPC